MKRVINKKVYDTETATKIATNDYSDGTNQFNCGRTADLYRTKKGNYFIVHKTHWQSESNSLRPLSQNIITALSSDEAIEEYENMFEQRKEFTDAFPAVKIEEA